MKKIIIKTFFQKKKIALAYFIMFLCINFFTLLFYYIFYSIENRISKIENKYENREVYVKINQKIQFRKMEKDILIEDVKPFFSPKFYKYNDVLIKVSPHIFGKQEKVIYGKKIDDLNLDEIIIPDYFYINNKKIDNRNLVNKIINLKNEEDEIEKKVVGLYKYNGYNNIYSPNLYSKHISNEYIFVTKKYNYTEEFIKKYSDYCDEIYLFDSSSQDELKIYKSLIDILSILNNFILLATVLVIVFIIKDYVKYYEKNIIMFKVYGYSDIRILYYIDVSILILFILQLIPIINVTLFLLFIRLINLNIIKQYYIHIIYIIILIIMIPIFFLWSIKKISLIDIIRQ